MAALVELKYGYDRAGNRLYRRDELGHGAGYDELYGYDNLQRLTAFDRGTLNAGNTGLAGSPTLTQDWTLDSTGNWKGFEQTVISPLTQTRTHNQVNEITGINETVGVPWTTPAYDAGGNMTMLPRPSDLTRELGATYDAWNRLTKLTSDDPTPQTVAEYEYDGLGRRAVKKVYDSSGTFDEARHYYFSDQWQSLEERLDAATTPERQQVWGARYVDDLVLRDRGSERLYALQDALFSVVAVTNASGAVQERFAYQPYGQSLPLNPNYTAYSGADWEWEQRFTGRELDLETGLQINRMRYLHLQLGRWATRDPIGYRGRDVNLYRYIAGGPITMMDPNGQERATDKVTGPHDIGEGDISGEYWIDADLNATWPPQSGFKILRPGQLSGDPRYAGVWVVVQDKNKGQPCGTGNRGTRQWASAFYVVQLYVERSGQRRPLPKGLGGEALRTWFLDQYTGQATNQDLPGFNFGGAFWDGPGILLPPRYLPAGTSLVYQRTYAIAIICVCKKEMLRKPVTVLYYTVTNAHDFLQGRESVEVIVDPNMDLSDDEITDWSGLKRLDGTTIGLKAVDQFSG